MLATRVAGKRIAMSRRCIARYGLVALFRVWMTLLRIHLQAFRLWLKGVGLVPRDANLGRSVNPKDSARS